MTEPGATPTPSRLRVIRLGQGLAAYAAHRRYVSYRQAEDDAARLALRLREALAAAGLAAARFRAVPRGGLIVLAMLAYHLDLPRRQLRGGDGDGEGGGDGGGPLVLVDDCALSGLRLRQELARLPPGTEVVVAHLYSPRELREAVLAAEPRVAACVAAQDLADLTAELFPDAAERAAWRRRWRRRLAAGDGGGGERRYWLGMPELVAFAWSEPDRPFWNDATGEVEDGWRFEPPHRCLKNRARLARGLPAAAPAVAPPQGGWHLADGVAWGEFDGVVWLCSGGDRAGDEGDEGKVFSLDGSAALVWKALVAGGGEAAAAVALEIAYEVDAETARRDVAALAGDLAAAGLLVAAAPPAKEG